MYVFVVFEIFFGVSYESREQKYGIFFYYHWMGCGEILKKYAINYISRGAIKSNKMVISYTLLKNNTFICSIHRRK